MGANDWSNFLKMFNGKAKGVIIVGALTTLLTSIFTFVINNKEFTESQFDRTSKILQVQIDDLREENRKLNQTINYERAERIKIQLQLSAITSTQFSRPFAEWVKLDGIMIFINKRYEDVFLKPRGLTIDDYLFKSDLDVWPPETAAAYKKNDDIVIRSGQVWKGIEKAPDGNGNMIEWIVYKYPYEVGFGPDKQIGVAGTAIPKDF
jgi:hypothetical protein